MGKVTLKELQDQAKSLNLPIEANGKNLTKAQIEEMINLKTEPKMATSKSVEEEVKEPEIKLAPNDVAPPYFLKWREEQKVSRKLRQELSEINTKFVPKEQFEKMKSNFENKVKVVEELKAQIAAIKKSDS